MAKSAPVWLVVLTLLASSAALGDRVTLRDGRVLVGTVTLSPGHVTIETSDFAISLPAEQVVSVERMPTPQAMLSERLAAVRPNDAQGLAGLAQWAAEQGLSRESTNLYRQVLLLDHDHAAARRALGYVRIAGQWMELAGAAEALAARIRAGPTDQALQDDLTAFAAACSAEEDKCKADELAAVLALRRGQFDAARQGLETLAAKAPSDAAPRLAAIAAILAGHADGMYVLTEPYPPESALLDSTVGSALPAGAASLSEPLVLEAALRDRAKEVIQAGRRLMAEAQAAEATDPAAAGRTYLLATKQFDTADALVPRIARGYKIEIIRRRIALLRRESDGQASLFDAELAELGKQSMTPQAYGQKVQRMMRYLRTIDLNLEEILKLAGPYDRDLFLEIKWAELDKQNIAAKLATLQQELHETH